MLRNETTDHKFWISSAGLCFLINLKSVKRVFLPLLDVLKKAELKSLEKAIVIVLHKNADLKTVIYKRKFQRAS